jgi:hypothetical protein
MSSHVCKVVLATADIVMESITLIDPRLETNPSVVGVMA